MLDNKKNLHDKFMRRRKRSLKFDSVNCHKFQSPPDQRKQVWISCNGVDDVDKENIKGFRYWPHGFPAYFYPYQNTPNYLSPLVAVEVLDVTRKY